MRKWTAEETRTIAERAGPVHRGTLTLQQVAETISAIILPHRSPESVRHRLLMEVRKLRLADNRRARRRESAKLLRDRKIYLEYRETMNQSGVSL